LWPFSIMGWPNGGKEEMAKFYPTNDLVTGPDIIFFWVARMIMAGCEFTGEIPFKNVYFTSIIRDDKGRKLSKSLGNSPDPLDVIAQYGADALRFTITYIAPVGMDIRYSNEKCELGRNFANKLWNACRFRRLQGPVTPDFRRLAPSLVLTSDERWMLAKLNDAISSITTALEEFRFHSAAHEVYELVWSNFCDWFIEAEKVPLRAGGEDKERALMVLDYALFRILKLLHPFMPFITEELAHQMQFVEEGKSIMFESFPTMDDMIFDPAQIELADGKFELVRAGRALKSGYNIPDGKKVNFHIKANSPEMLAFLREESASLYSLLNAAEIKLELDAFDTAANGAAPAQAAQLGTISLPLTGLIDVAAEKAKLNKQIAELDKSIAGSRAKLSNEKFLAKAPEKVIADAKALLEKMEARHAELTALLASLQ
ncbi:MAG: class I tRNA ligase family protein, partial [Lentisphaeria bacterium]|nr:class I tRNA ligase family protein [Lentisphaeria bacterium]